MNRTLVGWRATYTDGTRYDSAQHYWADLPIYGLQCLFKYWQDEGSDRIYMENHNGADAYIVYPIKSEADSLNYLTKVKFGEELVHADFKTLWRTEIDFAKANHITQIIDVI